MADPKKGELIRREAVLALSNVKVPAIALYATDVPMGSYLFGFDQTTDEGRKWIFSCEGESTKDPISHLEHPFLLRAWAAKKVMVNPQDGGDPITQVRVTLIDPDGDTMSFVSNGVLGSLDLLRTIYGDGPYNPPLALVTERIKTRGPGHVWKLRPADTVGPSKKSK